MRRAAKTDGCQSAIVKRLREISVWVQPLNAVGDGCPDLLCWHRGRYFLIECKEPGERPTKLQAEFMAVCPGEIHVVRTQEEAVLAAVGEAAMA